MKTQLNLVGKGITASESLKQEINAAVSQFENTNMPLSSVDAVFGKEGKQVFFEFVVHVQKGNPIVVKNTGDDIHRCCATSTKNALSSLRKIHDKKANPRRHKAVVIEED